jgi:hypothetical protein
MMGSIIQQIVQRPFQSSGNERLPGLRALRCTVTFGSPNKSLQRSVNHKVLGRGRVVSALWRAPRARVLTSQPAAAELSR